MRPGVRDFSTAYDRPPPPSEIRQEPLDGESGHYARLCALEDGALPRPRDFGDYADDICYMETVQAELFAHLLPACLEAWRHDLTHNHRSDYAGNVEIFQSALARRPLLEACLTPARAAAVLEHYPVLWDHLMGQSGSFGQARRAARCGSSGKRRNAADEPLWPTEGRVLLARGRVALLIRCPASHFEALLTTGQNNPVK